MSLNLNVEAIERLKQLVEQHYKEPVNGQFEDCKREVLPGAETESSGDEEGQKITTEELKRIVINVCNGNKVAVLIKCRYIVPHAAISYPILLYLNRRGAIS